MDGHPVTIAGLGFREGATASSLRAALNAALDQAGTATELTALATAWDKATAPAFTQFAAALGLPTISVVAEALQEQPAQPSDQVPARYGAHSLCEAAALAAAGPGAQLIAARAVSPDRLATAAIASNPNPRTAS